MRTVDRIDYVILNAGILDYPNVGPISQFATRVVVDFVASNRNVGLLMAKMSLPYILSALSSFDAFSNHLSTNAVGPILTAQKLLQTRIPIGTIAFMSSDSGSASEFRAFEDG